MNGLLLFRISLRSLGEHKARSFLTMLGIIIGVLAVTLLISVVQGATGEALTFVVDKRGGGGGDGVFLDWWRGGLWDKKEI